MQQTHSGLVTLTFDLLTLKVVSESRVTWAISAPIFVFLGLSVLDLGPMYATDRQTRQTDVRQTDVRQKHRLMPPSIRDGGIIITSWRRAAATICLCPCKLTICCVFIRQVAPNSGILAFKTSATS